MDSGIFTHLIVPFLSCKNTFKKVEFKNKLRENPLIVDKYSIRNCVLEKIISEEFQLKIFSLLKKIKI